MKSLRVVVVSAVFLAAGLLGMNAAFGAGVHIEDDFTGSDNDPWNQAIWTDQDVNGGQSSIQSDEGHLQVAAVGDIARQLADNVQHEDFDARFTQRFHGQTDAGGGNDKRFGFEFRRSSAWASSNPDAPETGYQLHHQQEQNRIILWRFDANGNFEELDQDVNIDRTLTHRFRVRAEGDSIQVKWWEAGTAEPSGWNFEVTDNTYPTGNAFSFTHWSGGGETTKVAIVDDLIIDRLGNLPPVAVDDAYQTHRNTPLVVAAPGVLGNDSDPDEDPLTAELVAGPSDGDLVLNEDGGFTYTPDTGFVGEDSFTYVAKDDEADSNEATVTITVVNRAPVAGDNAYETNQDTSLVVAAPGVLGNDSDPDGDPLTAVLSAGPSSGNLSLNANGGFTYTPNTGFSGTDNFTYRAFDGLTHSNVATVAITVNAVDDPDPDPDPEPEPEPDPSFVDIDGSIFTQDILWLAKVGITRGCNPPANDRFCPNDFVTRGQMAAFFVRALDLTDRLDDPFVDDDGNTFEADIERLAAADITRGCNPPVNDRFCPNDFVTRGQMAAFFHRAADLLGLPS